MPVLSVKFHNRPLSPSPLPPATTSQGKGTARLPRETSCTLNCSQSDRIRTLTLASRGLVGHQLRMREMDLRVTWYRSFLVRIRNPQKNYLIKSPLPAMRSLTYSTWRTILVPVYEFADLSYICGSRRLPARFRQWALPPADDE